MSNHSSIPGYETADSIGHVIFSRGQELGRGNKAYGTYPSPFEPHFKEYQRRKANSAIRADITMKIESLLEPRFITPPETAELIESIVTATDSRNILELGTYSGFTSLHILRAIVGKDKARLTSVDCDPSFDSEFFAQSGLGEHFRHIPERTPECLAKLKGEKFDLVFIDSDHAVDHCEKERLALMEITDPGSIWLFHDVPQWPTPENHQQPPVRDWLDELVANRFFFGACLPTCEQLDCLLNYGPGYPKACNPGLGVYIRR